MVEIGLNRKPHDKHSFSLPTFCTLHDSPKCFLGQALLSTCSCIFLVVSLHLRHRFSLLYAKGSAAYDDHWRSGSVLWSELGGRCRRPPFPRTHDYVVEKSQKAAGADKPLL